MNTEKVLRKIIVWSFIIVPLISSAISALHIVDFFSLGNPSWLSVALAIAIELGSIASFLTLSILNKLNKTIVWTVFIILFFMQIVGNMYFSYDYISESMKHNPNWISSFRGMMEFFTGEVDVKNVMMYLTILISWPIPIISVFLLKSAMDYLKPEEVKELNSSDSNSIFDMNSQKRENLRAKLKDVGIEKEN